MSAIIRLPDIEWECVLFVETRDGTELTIYSDCTASTKGEAEQWCEGLAKRMKMALVGCEARVKGTAGHLPSKDVERTVVAVPPLSLPAPTPTPEPVKPEEFFDKQFFTRNDSRPAIIGTQEDI